MAVIGRVGVERAVAQAPHERRAVGGRAQRRRHHVAQPVRALVLLALEAQVMGADLGVDGLPARSRGRDLLERPCARDVHDVRRGTGDLGERQEAVHALGFQLDRAAAGERIEAQSPGRDELPGEQIDRPPVLAVGERHDPELGGLLQDRESDVVLGHDAELDVGQPELHAADAERRHVAQVARLVRARLPDHGVEREIDQGGGQLIGERAAGRLDRALAVERIHEGQRARRAAAERRARVVANAAEDVRVHVDGPRQHQTARRVDHLGTRAIDVPDRSDQAVLDQHVGRDGALRGDHPATGDHDAHSS